MFFDESTFTFDQAPFRRSAAPKIAKDLRDALLLSNHSNTEVQSLKDFADSFSESHMPNDDKIHDS